MSTAVISVRVPKRLKEEAERLGVDLRRTIEEALIKAIKEERMRRIADALRRISEETENLTVEGWVEAVRSSRRRKTTTLPRGDLETIEESRSEAEKEGVPA